MNHDTVFKHFSWDSRLLQRYFWTLIMILSMVGTAELSSEPEILFPEMAALTIGLWIVNKRVWLVSRLQLILLMTAGAAAGVCIVRYSPFPVVANLALAFGFAALCLLCTRTTLIPLISACMLPVLLHTQTWLYPTAVAIMSVLLITGQRILERQGLRPQLPLSSKQNIPQRAPLRWGLMLLCVAAVSSLAYATSCTYLILPPLIVTFAEFVQSKAGFRNRPLQTVFLLVSAASLGTVFRLLSQDYLHLPQTLMVLFTLLCLFSLFEYLGKYFAPAGALALIPFLLPSPGLVWLPLQVLAGAILLLSIAFLLFLKCYKWPKAHLLYCLTPTRLRKSLKHHKKTSPF